MRITHSIVAVAAVCLVGTTTQALDTYTVDHAHSSIGFSIDHMVIDTVHGRFRQFDGSITVDPDNGNALKQASATIQTRSIDTDVQRRDDHLRSADFFDTEKNPTITFESTGVNGQTLTGKFTMHGVTKEVSLPYTIKGPIKDPMGNVHLALEARTKLNRKDYGISWNKTLDSGGLMLGEEVNIEINGSFVKQAAEKK
ncbi:MAG TPA: YceI family protein [Verrucomicrobiae bacterium]|nr:YceI family protein [Verrucomicrobiae bacterium]